MISSPQKFDVSQSIAAGATFNALAGWKYETPDQDCMLEVIERATAVGLVGSITSAGDIVKQEGPIQAGGTAGTTPARLNTEPVTGRAKKFQKLDAFYRNPTAGAITLDATYIIVPLGGARAGGGGGVRRRPSFRRRRK